MFKYGYARVILQGVGKGYYFHFVFYKYELKRSSFLNNFN